MLERTRQKQKAVFRGRKRGIGFDPSPSSAALNINGVLEPATPACSPPFTMAPPQPEENVYQPKDAIASTMKITALTGGVGLLASAVQNTLTRQNVGPWGVLTRTGGTIGIFGMSSSKIDVPSATACGC